VSLETTARAIVDATSYMTLGTADEDGVPWVTPVWYAAVDYREFLWISRPEARHSRNIAVRPQVSIVFWDSHVPIDTGKGVYFSARAEQVTDAAELARGMEIFSRTSQAQGGQAYTADDVGETAPFRLYRAVTSECWIGMSGQRTLVAI
jgi:pyridoxine/pyridoxamine 5'-phosphate oxidase